MIRVQQDAKAYKKESARDDLQEQVSLLNSTLLMSVNELQELYNSLNSTQTLKNEAIMNELNTIRNIMYVSITATAILIATTVYLTTRKPNLKRTRKK